jgi:hypothetical protein
MMAGAQAEGSSIPEAVAFQTATEEVEVVVSLTGLMEGATPEPEAAVATKVVVGAHVDALPEASTEVVMLLTEILNPAPIRSASMAEAMSTSRGGVELLADDLV